MHLLSLIFILTNLLLIHLLLGSVEETTMTFKTTYVIGILLVQFLVKIRFSSEIISILCHSCSHPFYLNCVVPLFCLWSCSSKMKWPFASEELADAVTFRRLGSPMLFQRLVQLESCKSLDTLEQHTTYRKVCCWMASLCLLYYSWKVWSPSVVASNICRLLQGEVAGLRTDSSEKGVNW